MTDTPDDLDTAGRQLDETRLRRVGDTIRAERSRKRLTQQQLADLIGVHKQTVINIENARTDTSILTIWHIADSLGLAITDLL